MPPSRMNNIVAGYDCEEIMEDLTMSSVLGAAEDDNNSIRYPVSSNWMQGRTTYGGFSSALLLNTARSHRDDLPPLRSALINFTAPIGSSPAVCSEILRQGRNVTTVSTRAEIDGKTVATGTFTFGRSQDSQYSVHCPPKPAKDPEQSEPYFPPEIPKPPAAFLDNFEIKLIEGARPFSGAERGYVRLWARHRDEKIRDSIEGLISIADMPPPAIFTMLNKPAANSSINWIFNVLSEDVRTRDGWWLMEHELTAGRNGYSSQVMRMWNTDGDLVVDGMQSVIIFA